MNNISNSDKSYTQAPNKIGVHLLRHDIRLVDNAALYRLCEQCSMVYVLYCFENKWLTENQYGHIHLGEHRHKFLDQALSELEKEAIKFNIRTIFIRINNYSDILETLTSLNPDAISYELHYGFYEQQQIEFIKNNIDNVSFIEGRSNYLLRSLPFGINDMPNVFSPFRRKIEKQLDLREKNSHGLNECELKLPVLIDLPKSVELYLPKKCETENGYTGGESSALSRLEHYFFETDNISQYKETRNGLDGWDFSSRFSAFLAIGCISPATILEQLKLYETTHVKNDSTYWLFFELLWREFFHLQLSKHDNKFFKFTGIQGKTPSTTHDHYKFTRWVRGETGYKIVDACMKQLASTGFMSNRGRQLVASCFVHELGLDWRWGASYFEQMLIDFDVASNYGNWQYLAGVGSDPRGHRQFNLAKQTDIYDPNHKFINTYLD